MKNIHKIEKELYITSEEEIKEGVDQWYLDRVLNEPYNSGGAQYSSKQDVIILTTDADLIKNGVQAIDDEFLEWFVKNPSCEEVKVIKHLVWEEYKIIIPKEEQEKLEEARDAYNASQERSYNEEEVLHILDTLWDKLDIWYNEGYPTEFNLKDWFNKCELKKK